MFRNSHVSIEYNIVYGNSVVTDWSFMWGVLSNVTKPRFPYTCIALIGI
jgi:hypothetical protein